MSAWSSACRRRRSPSARQYSAGWWSRCPISSVNVSGYVPRSTFSVPSNSRSGGDVIIICGASRTRSGRRDPGRRSSPRSVSHSTDRSLLSVTFHPLDPPVSQQQHVLRLHVLAGLAELAQEIGRGLEHRESGDTLVPVTQNCGSCARAQRLELADKALVVDLEAHGGTDRRQVHRMELGDGDPRAADLQAGGVGRFDQALDVLCLHTAVHHDHPRRVRPMIRSCAMNRAAIQMFWWVARTSRTMTTY